MMKKVFFIVTVFSLLLMPYLDTAAQTNEPSVYPGAFDTTGFPQWAKDLRRFDIITFGTFPFSMLFTSIFFDLYRWNEATGMDFSEAGRRYAPWPLKSAGGYEWSGDDYRTVLLFAAGLSLVFAITDLIIVIVKRNNERRRTESFPPSGSVNINRRPVDSIDTNDEPPDIDEPVNIYEIINIDETGLEEPLSE